MNTATLSLEQTPPLSVPLRFFLTAPLFALLASILLLYQGESLLINRWNFSTLALIHLLTLGFTTMVMIGALLQLLPVLAAVSIPKPLWTATFLHGLLTIGTLCLCLGFYITHFILLKLALLILILTFILLFNILGYCLFKAIKTNITIAMRFATIALGVTVIIGFILIAFFTYSYPLPKPHIFTNVHLTWGLIGWTLLLIIGVAYQIVPMFQITPPYPNKLANRLVFILFSLLVLWTISYLLANVTTQFPTFIAQIFAGFIVIGIALFAITTLNLQRKRLRKLPDISLNYWQVGMTLLLLTLALWVTAQFRTTLAYSSHYPALMTVLYVNGFVLSVIQGTLYKVVPFIIWLHLQNKQMSALETMNPVNTIAIPTMKEIITVTQMRYQFGLYIAGLIVLIVAVYWTILLPSAAMILTLSFLVLTYNLYRAVWIYRRIVTTYHVGKMVK
jgi:hypothetical protein